MSISDSPSPEPTFIERLQERLDEKRLERHQKDIKTFKKAIRENPYLQEDFVIIDKDDEIELLQKKLNMLKKKEKLLIDIEKTKIRIKVLEQNDILKV